MKKLLALLVLCVCLPPGGTAAEEAPRERTGLAVGQKAPDFTLKDQHGADVALQSLLKKGSVALVFFRSADW